MRILAITVFMAIGMMATGAVAGSDNPWRGTGLAPGGGAYAPVQTEASPLLPVAPGRITPPPTVPTSGKIGTYAPLETAKHPEPTMQ